MSIILDLVGVVGQQELQSFVIQVPQNGACIITV